MTLELKAGERAAAEFDLESMIVAAGEIGQQVGAERMSTGGQLGGEITREIVYVVECREFAGLAGTDQVADNRVPKKPSQTEGRKYAELLAAGQSRIKDGVELTDDVIASVRTSGLIGDKFIKLSPGGSDEVLGDGDVIIETESALDIEELVSKYVFGDV